MKPIRVLGRGALLAAALLTVPACGRLDHSSVVNLDWFVDPAFGDDFSGDGSPAFPFRTITRALSLSISGDGVILATGTYSASSGEVFPLRVKPGVFVLGDTASHGSTTAIVGAGSYTILGGLQMGNAASATLVLGSGASVSGVKVTASGGSAMGVVFDGTSGALTFCTITGCGGAGVAVFQSGSPTVSNNVLTSNGTTGLTAFDSATPNLRLNSITTNGTDGVLAADTSVPNLGDSGSSGGNTIQGNTGVGLNNATTASTVDAVGNAWIALTQGSDASGHYASGPPTPGTVAAAAGNNFAITNAAAAIQF